MVDEKDCSKSNIVGLPRKEDADCQLEQFIANYNAESTRRMLDSIGIVDGLKKSASLAVGEADKGFALASTMYLVTFIFGLSLIVAAFVSAYFNSTFATVLFGSAGTVQLVAFFLKNPPLMLQQNRAQLAKLKAAYYSWFLDTENWVQLIYDLSVNGPKTMLKVNDMKVISDSIADSTQKFMAVFPTGQDQQAQPAKADSTTKKDGKQAEGAGKQAAATSDVYDNLAKLAKLRDDGIVTEQEFQEQKKKLLGN
jgi:hypothetical protein